MQPNFSGDTHHTQNASNISKLQTEVCVYMGRRGERWPSGLPEALWREAP